MIPEEQLLEFAGTSTFNKGKSLFRQGSALLQTQSANKISGIVSGTYDYRVSITLQNEGWNCSCNCPAFDYQAVCKHCVALALAYHNAQSNELLNTTEKSTGEAKVSDPKQNKDELLKQYITNLPNEQLHDALYELICDNKYQYTRWVNKALMASQQQDLKSLKKLVTKSLPMRDIWEYRKVADYFDNAKQSLSDVLDIAATIPAEEQLKLIFHIYDRLDKVTERVDDSGGFRFHVQYLLSDTLPKVISRQTWDADEKAQWLVNCLKPDFESFPEIPGDFQLNETEMTTFLERCQSEFDAIEVSSDINNRQVNYDLRRLGETLLSHLPQAKRFDVALNIKFKMLSDLYDALNISQFCLDNNDELTAEDWLLKAKGMLKMPGHQSDWNTQAIRVYSALGETEKAWAIAWNTFLEHPGYYAWELLKNEIKVIGWHPETLNSDVETCLLEIAKGGRDDRFGWHHDDIVSFYLSEKEFGKVVSWLNNNAANEDVLSEAAVAVAADFPDNAIQYSAQALSEILQYSDNGKYGEAISLLKEVQNQLPDSTDIEQLFAELIHDTIQQNKRRPNMMAMLRSEFGQYF